MATVPFFFGLGSRYSYLAATQLDRIEAECGVTFEWIPLSSMELIRRANGGQTPFDRAPTSGQYDFAFRQHDAESWAAYYGVPYREPESFRVDPDALAKACWAADGAALMKAMVWRLFQGVFVEGAVVTEEVLASYADDIGWSAPAFHQAFGAPEATARHEAALDRALADGAFGVPTFIIDGKVFWGNDRLPLVRHFLTATG